MTQEETIVWHPPTEKPEEKGFYIVQLDLNPYPNDNWYEILLWKNGHFCWDWVGHKYVDEDVIAWSELPKGYQHE